MFKSVPFNSVPAKIFLNIFTEKLRHNFFESFFFRNFEFETVLKTPAGQLACDPAVWYYTPWTNSGGTMFFFPAVVQSPTACFVKFVKVICFLWKLLTINSFKLYC